MVHTHLHNKLVTLNNRLLRTMQAMVATKVPPQIQLTVVLLVQLIMVHHRLGKLGMLNPLQCSNRAMISLSHIQVVVMEVVVYLGLGPHLLVAVMGKVCHPSLATRLSMMLQLRCMVVHIAEIF